MLPREFFFFDGSRFRSSQLKSIELPIHMIPAMRCTHRAMRWSSSEKWSSILSGGIIQAPVRFELERQFEAARDLEREVRDRLRRDLGELAARDRPRGRKGDVEVDRVPADLGFAIDLELH